MASTYDAPGPSTGTAQHGTTTSITWTQAVAGPNPLVLAGVAVDVSPDGAFTTTATCGGTAMTSIGKVHGGGSNAGYLEVFKLAAPSAGSNTIVVTAAGGTPGGMGGGSIAFAGADQTTGVGTAATASGTGTTASTAVPSNTSGNVIASFAAQGNASSTGGTVTKRVGGNGVSGAGAGFFDAGTIAATGSSVTTTFTYPGSDFFAILSAEVLAAGAGGGVAVTSAAHLVPPGLQSPAAWAPLTVPQVSAGPPVIPALTVTAGLASGAGVAAVPSFGTYITGLASPTGASYFTDNHGAPRMWVGDEIWALLTNAGRWNSGNYQSTFDTYFAARAAQGFTICYSDMFNSTFIGGATNGQNWAGQTPFTSNNPSSGLNSTYWQVIDYALNSALANGITIALSFGGHWDWDVSGNAMFGFTGTQYQAAGNAIGTRYKNQPNLIWLIMDDYFSSFDSSLNSLLTGLRASGDTHPIAIENYAETSSRFDLPGSTSLAWGAANTQYNFGYSYSCTYLCIEYMFAEASPLTPIYGDGYFYQGGSTYDASLDRAIRQDAWWALTSGATGFNVGDEALWQWPSTAPGVISTQWYAANNTANIRAYVEGLTGWQTLAPATGSALITAGRGTRATQLASGGGGGQYEPAVTNTYVSASRTPDTGSGSSLALLYLPVATTITIDQTKLVSGYTATWVDPVTCATSSATAGATYNSTAKGNNSRGAPDWVLVLKAPAGTSVTAVLASGTGTAQGAAPAVAVNAVAATEAGAALSPAVSVGVNAAAATEVGAALNAAPAVAVTAALAAGTGAALNATASTTTSGSAAATLAAAAGAALNATPAIGVNAALAAGTGAALNPAVTTTASPPATAAAGAGTAQGATVSVAPVAAAATGTGTARNATAAITVTAVLAAGTGAAQGATASTVTSGTANAAPATGTGTARSPAAAIAVTAGPATGTGTAAPVTGPVTAWRLFPSASGPSAPVSYAGNFLCGVIFKVTDGAQWFGGYYKWVAAGGDTTARKFALWQVTGAGAGVLLPAATVTSGTLTAGQWNFIPLATPVKLAIGTAYNACTGWTAVHGFEDSDTAGSGTGATDSFGTGGHTAGIVTGPLTAFSDHAFSRPEPYGMAQGVFSVAGTDPAVIMPSTGSNSGNFWIDVQVSPTGPAGYPGPYRLWPGKLDTNPGTTTDAAVNYDIATEFAISQPCLLGKVWYFSPPGTAQLATAANVWSITGGGLTGTLAAQASSPSWSGAAASGWVSCTFTGVVLPPGTYKVSVYNSAAVPDNWGAKDALTDYWRAGEGGNGITWGPLSAPNLAGASLAYLYDGSMGGHTPPFTDGTTLAGQPTFTQGPPDSYPYLYAPVTSPTSGSTQNYWIDVEVTPVIPAGLASGAGAAQPPAAAAGVNAGLAAGTGTAQGATAAAAPAVTAAVASGTGAALGAVAASAASPAAVLAGGASAALNPAAAIGVTAAPATGTGAAQGPAVTATAGPAATAATGAGAALNATASTVTSGTANAVLATGTGAAGSATPAIGAVAALASGTGTALNATVSTAAFTNAQAGLATGTGTARNPGLTLTSNATAATATGTGATAATAAVGVNAAAATSAGTGRNAVGQAGWVAPAGLAAGTGTAQPPAAVLVSLAQAAAATALGAALRATAKTVDPFTVGTLTTATTATGVLTAATAAGGGGTLTASDQRTGGPT